MQGKYAQILSKNTIIFLNKSAFVLLSKITTIPGYDFNFQGHIFVPRLI